MRFDVMKMFPDAVEVGAEELAVGESVLAHNPDGVEDALFCITVKDVDHTYDGSVESSEGYDFRFSDTVFYRIPPQLPTETGSLIRNVVVSSAISGVDYRCMSGTLLPDGTWYVVTADEGYGPVEAGRIISFEAVQG